MIDNIYSDEIKKLMLHCGISVEMDWHPDGSAANISKCEGALKYYFGFNDYTDYKERIWNLLVWKSWLKSNLDNGRPIIYSGQDKAINATEAHAWVIDGYDSDDRFYCNWGLGGADDGPYSIGDFYPGSHDFNELQDAVMNIVPIRITGIEKPTLNDQTFTYSSSGYNLTGPQA